ncbi:MAG: HNH endonuclease [Gemmataceae bacterium]|nr:HNH endonuclease [Gemmataceae bacterium]
MSVVSESLRAAVEERAGHRCEYCHLPTRGQVATFPVDHTIPQSSGGPTELDNLALACPHCNAHKWAHTDAPDPATGRTVPLFNPRHDRWEEHFGWLESDPAILEGKTRRGRATIERLQMNHPNMVDIRRLLLTLGLFLG